MRHVIVYPTWRCGLKCPYCQYKLQDDGLSMKYGGSGRVYPVPKELMPDELLSKLLEFKDATYEFTGGEPFRYRELKTILNSLPGWAMTSNTLHSVDDLDFSRCFAWTASFHPHISGRAKDKFMFNIQSIREKVKTVAVTLVAYPRHVARSLMWADRFDRLGFAVNVHPYYEDPNFSWGEYPEEWALLKGSRFRRYQDRFFKFSGVEGSPKCYAGKDYFVVAPDGRVFPCATEMLFGGEPLKEVSESYRQCKRTCYVCCDWHYGIREGFWEIF